MRLRRKRAEIKKNGKGKKIGLHGKTGVEMGFRALQNAHYNHAPEFAVKQIRQIFLRGLKKLEAENPAEAKKIMDEYQQWEKEETEKKEA